MMMAYFIFADDFDRDRQRNQSHAPPFFPRVCAAKLNSLPHEIFRQYHYPSCPVKIGGLESLAEGNMSTVYNPESDLIAEIERLEINARDIRRKVDFVRAEEDKRVLNRLLKEMKEQIEFLRHRIP
jgi:hypothetical protein